MRPNSREAISTWRELYAPVIARVISEHADPASKIDAEQRREIRRKLRATFPYSDGANRRSHQYKAWLEEARVQLGLKPPGRDRGRPPKVPRDVVLSNPKQFEMFPEVATSDVRLIESVIKAHAAGRSAGAIHKAAPHVISYPAAVRIIDLAGKGKTPDQILRYLEDDERRRQVVARPEGKEASA
jgi:hypothetical protein